MKHTEDFEEMIARYRAEMMQLHKRSTAPEPIKATAVSEVFPVQTTEQPQEVAIQEAPSEAAPPMAETEAEAEAAPEPPTVQDAKPPPADDTVQPFETDIVDPLPPSPADLLTDLGTLSVHVYTARGAIPLPGVVVRITDKNTGVHVLVTDENGVAPLIVLPAIDRELTLKPGLILPTDGYTVTATLPGYITVQIQNILLYGGMKALQGIEMIPLTDADRYNDVQRETVLQSRPPVNL